jgi:HAD superfamily hydrolase (TIGR01509 family)
MLKLVIWDCDGVLVDSEMIVNKIFVEQLRNYKVDLTIIECLQKFTGKNTRAIYDELSTIRGKAFSELETQGIQNAIEDQLAKTVTPISGVDRLLKTLGKMKIKVCVASSGQLPRIKKVLTKTGLIEAFTENSIFSSSMVNFGKPAPDLFLLAAKAMGIEPHSCLVVEDSPAGIQAAKSAEMKVVGFLGAEHTQFPWYYENILKLKPDHIANNMEMIYEVITNYAK